MGVGAGTAAAISVAATVASTAVGVIGAISSANAQAADANYKAQVARNNSIVAGQNAQYSIQAGQEKAQEESLKGRERQGRVTAGLAANGLDVSSGTPADIRETQKESDVLSTQRVVDAAALQAYGYRTQSTNFSAEAGLEKTQASQAGTAGDLAAFGGLLAGASSVGKNYAQFQNAGVFGSSKTFNDPSNG